MEVGSSFAVMGAGGGEARRSGPVALGASAVRIVLSPVGAI